MMLTEETYYTARLDYLENHSESEVSLDRTNGRKFVARERHLKRQMTDAEKEKNRAARRLELYKVTQATDAQKKESNLAKKMRKEALKAIADQAQLLDNKQSSSSSVAVSKKPSSSSGAASSSTAAIIPISAPVAAPKKLRKSKAVATSSSSSAAAAAAAASAVGFADGYEASDKECGKESSPKKAKASKETKLFRQACSKQAQPTTAKSTTTSRGRVSNNVAGADNIACECGCTESFAKVVMGKCRGGLSIIHDTGCTKWLHREHRGSNWMCAQCEMSTGKNNEEEEDEEEEGNDDEDEGIN